MIIRARIIAVKSCLLIAFFATTAAWAASPTVDLELVTEPGLSIDAPHKWIEMLKDMGLGNLRVRQGERGDKAAIREGGSEKSPHYTVTGLVTAANVLKLPGANIRLNDKQAMRDWLVKLKDGGQQEVVAKKVMFGLNAKQMVEIHEQLKTPVAFDTKGERSGAMLAKIVAALNMKVSLGEGAEAIAKSNEPVADELHGLAAGTALAAILRPLGFVFVPEKPLGQPLQLRVVDSQAVEKPWPIGWDSPITAGKLVPDYFKATNAEITEFALSDALNAIQPRVNIPFLYDYNGMARQKIEPAQVKVSSKKGKKSYASVVDEILYQGRLKAEVRIDEAEHPFLWITPQR